MKRQAIIGAFAWGLALALGALAPHLVLAQAPPVVPTTGFSGGAASKHYLSLASDNSTSVSASPTVVYAITGINTTTTIYYLKLYNEATAPVCGSDAIVATYPIPYGASNSGGGFHLPFPTGKGFPAGLGFCIVAGIGDSNDASAATGIAVDFDLGTRAPGP